MPSHPFLPHKSILLVLLALILTLATAGLSGAQEENDPIADRLLNALAFPTAGVTHVVTTTDDAGPGSLRQAILDASGGDTITFSPLLFDQTIELAEDLPDIDKELTIDGRMAPMLTITGKNTFRSGFSVLSGGSLTVVGLTFNKGANSGGGAFLVDQGSLTLYGVTLTDNSAFTGGAVENKNGELIIANSTIHNNESTTFMEDGGGALHQIGANNPQTTIYYSTITNNTAVSPDKDGLWIESGQIGIIGTLLDHVGGSCKIEAGASVSSGGHNIDHDGNPGGNPCQLTNATDQVDTPLLLALLADNGGPTMTRAIDSDSPAFQNIPLGQSGCGDPITYDQRGGVRSLDLNCDSGAVELLGCQILNDDTSFVFINNKGLQLAIDLADPGDTLLVFGLCPGTNSGVSVRQTVIIDKNITLQGKFVGEIENGQVPILDPQQPEEQPILDAMKMGRVVLVNNNAEVTINSVTLTRGFTPAEPGGGLLATPGTNVTLMNSMIRNSLGTIGGGAAFQGPGQISFTTMTGNGANGGGALYANAFIPVDHSTFTNNISQFGGAVYIDADGSLQLNTSTLSHNSVPGTEKGGALANLGTLKSTDTTFSDNRAGRGGAIFNSGSIEINLAKIVNNESVALGGGIYNDLQGDTELVDSTLQNNSSTSGGAVSNKGTFLIGGSSLLTNLVTASGAGIFNEPAAQMSVFNSTIGENKGGTLSGAGIDNKGTLSLLNSTVTLNKSTVPGAGLNNTGSATVINSIIADYSSGDCQSTGTLNLSYSLVMDGTCSAAAGDKNLTGDPLLNPLSDNGGPTLTYALLGNSPAIDKGNEVVCVEPLVNGVDQRGMPRLGICDIGAYEWGTKGPADMKVFMPVIIGN